MDLAHFDLDLTFRMYSTYIFKSNRWNLKQPFIYNKGEWSGTQIKQILNSKHAKISQSHSLLELFK